MSSRIAALLGVMSLAALALGGCAASDNGSKEEVGTYEGELKLSSPKLLGTIANGETKSGYYYNPPKYRAYSFLAKAGDQITVDVHSVEGDAMAWITDSGYNSLAANDDAEDEEALAAPLALAIDVNETDGETAAQPPQTPGPAGD